MEQHKSELSSLDSAIKVGDFLPISTTPRSSDISQEAASMAVNLTTFKDTYSQQMIGLIHQFESFVSEGLQRVSTRNESWLGSELSSQTRSNS